jgi:hypothetical protein
MNLHIMRMQAGSELTQRAMRVATWMPLNHPNFKQEVMDKICKPNGYMTVSVHALQEKSCQHGCIELSA